MDPWQAAVDLERDIFEGKVVGILCADWSSWANEEGGPEGAARRIADIVYGEERKLTVEERYGR